MAESKDSGKARAVSIPQDGDEYDFDEIPIAGVKTTRISPSARPAGMIDLDLSFTAAEAKSAPSIQERDILVIFDLPDGSQDEKYFKLGQTVEVLKSFVESEYGIPMYTQTLYLDDMPMMDPLSLLDFPDAKGLSEMYVRVDGPLPSESKK